MFYSAMWLRKSWDSMWTKLRRRFYRCDNQVETANSQRQNNAAQTTDESSQSPLQNQNVADLDTEISSHACSCETGCSTRRCGCVNRGIRCGKQCACTYYGCTN